MNSRFLITTADERSWRTDVPVLFLGDWCKRHSRRDVWARLDTQTMAYHWDDRSKLQADYLYLRDFHETLLEDLTPQLNRIHRVNHSLRYWRILIGLWLGYFTQMLFDRWTSIQQAVSEFTLSETIVLFDAGATLVPNDMAEFAGMFIGDEWNHHIYASILQRFTELPCSRRERKLTAPQPSAGAPPISVQGIKLRLASLYTRFAATLTRETDAFFISTHLPVLDEMRMHRRFGQVPQLWQMVPAVRVPVDADRRKWIVDGRSKSDFETCARTLIPQNIPVAYLEGYSGLMSQTEGLPWPGRPRVIWTSNAQFYDDVFKAWAAAKVEAGSPFAIGQHGGHYGMGCWSFQEDHEIASSDRYLTWGWSEPRQPKTHPVGQLKARHPLGVRHPEQSSALLVTLSLPRFSYVMYSVCVAGQLLDYIADQFAFVEELPPAIKDALIVRLFPHDHGWDHAARWRERFPGVRTDMGQTRMEDLVRGCRLFISTYNATTYLESITMDVPTVVYWNERHWELRESATGYFEDLQRVGIFHTNPRSAAHHVASIWDHVDSWWSSTSVQEVVHRFKRRYCDLPQDLLGRLERVLRAMAAETRMTSAW